MKKMSKEEWQSFNDTAPIYTKENATQCIGYSDSHINGCCFSPSAQEAFKKSWACILCHRCVIKGQGLDYK